MDNEPLISYEDLEEMICRLERTLRMASVFCSGLNMNSRAYSELRRCGMFNGLALDIDCISNVIGEAADCANNLRTDFYEAHAAANRQTARAA